MSLLMDALKRAEENKQGTAKSTNTPSPAPTGLRLEPLPEPATPDTHETLPDLADHIAAVDADLAASASNLPPRPAGGIQTTNRTTPTDAAREAVRNAFAAKEAEPPSRHMLWLILGLIGTAAIGIGAYVWYQVQGMSRSSLAVPPSSSRPPAQPAAIAPPAAAVSLPPLPSPAPSPAATEYAMPIPAAPMRRTEPSEKTPDSAAASAAAPVRLVRTRPEVDPGVGRGYRSLQAGDIGAARTDYEQALRRDPKNVDALLGLAAIAQREGRQAEAERFWQLAFEVDPKDATAQAAIVGMAAAADPVAAESRLKTLLAAQPESGPLNFALANLYARQHRWAEAQQAYFNAVAADGDNPDYLFNLAVSLDHLRQPTLAAQHYRLALEAVEKRAAAFDREQARRRLLILQP